MMKKRSKLSLFFLCEEIRYSGLLEICKENRTKNMRTVHYSLLLDSSVYLTIYRSSQNRYLLIDSDGNKLSCSTISQVVDTVEEFFQQKRNEILYYFNYEYFINNKKGE